MTFHIHVVERHVVHASLKRNHTEDGLGGPAEAARHARRGVHLQRIQRQGGLDPGTEHVTSLVQSLGDMSGDGGHFAEISCGRERLGFCRFDTCKPRRFSVFPAFLRAKLSPGR